MSPKKPPEFKASERYDWHSELSEERGSSFFFDDSTHASPVVRRRPSVSRRASSFSVGIFIVVVLGAVGLVAMVRLLQD
jgi:hypothetical protein